MKTLDNVNNMQQSYAHIPHKHTLQHMK